MGSKDAVDQPEDRRPGIQTCQLDRTNLSTFVSEVLNDEEVRLASTVVIITDSRPLVQIQEEEPSFVNCMVRLVQRARTRWRNSGTSSSSN